MGFFAESRLTQTRKPLPLLPRCGECGLYAGCESPKMPVSGEGQRGILIVGEAPGADEDAKGVQFVGKAGRKLRETLQRHGLSPNKDCWFTNSLICFVSPKVRIYTTEGYKWIKDVQVGDLVLTHKGRFKRVLSRSMDLPDDLRRVKTKVVDIRTGQKKLTVTADHLFLSDGKWKRADTISVGDKLTVLGEKCLVCQTVYFKNPGRFDSAESTCSPRCHNVLVGKKNGPAVSEALKLQYKEGKRNAKTGLAKAHRKVRKLVKEGKWSPGNNATPESRRMGRVLTAKKRQRWNGFYTHPMVGVGERQVADFLSDKGLKYCHQFAIGSRNFDFYLPKFKLLVEIENPRSFGPNKSAKLKRWRERRIVAKKRGYRLVHLKTPDPVSEIKRVLKNDSHEYHFTTTTVTEVKVHKAAKQSRLYCLEVEKDYSYISVGLVSHNCRPPDNKIQKQEQIDFCRPNLLNAITRLKPKVIILLGRSAVKSLIGFLWKEDIGDMERWQGWRIPSQRLNAWVCPTWHPSYLLRSERNGSPDAVLEMYFDRHIREAVKKTERPWKKLPEFESRVDVIHDPEEAADRLRLMDKKGGLFTFDLETNMLKPDSDRGRIVCCSVCHEGKDTFAFPWHGEAIRAMKFVLQSKRTRKAASNKKFEIRWTRCKLGIEVRNWDWCTMLAAHVIDNRHLISSIKFQAFVLLGQEGWNAHVEPYLKSKEQGGYSENRIDECDPDDLMRYCAVDSLMEYKVMSVQKRRLGC